MSKLLRLRIASSPSSMMRSELSERKLITDDCRAVVRRERYFSQWRIFYLKLLSLQFKEILFSSAIYSEMQLLLDGWIEET